MITATYKNIDTIVISSIINKIDNYSILLHNLKEEFFYENKKLRTIFKELKDMFLAGNNSFEEITLFLSKNNTKPETIKSLIEIEHNYTAEFLFEFMIEKVGQRKLEEAYKNTEEMNLSERIAKISSVTAEILEISKNDDLKDANSSVEDYMNYLAEMHRLQMENGGIVGISTRIPELDRRIQGLKNQDYIIVAARPSMGKTAFTLGLITSTIYLNKVAVFFSLEMPTEQIMGRLLSQINSDLSLSETMYATNFENTKEHIESLTEYLKTKKFYIEDFVNKKTKQTKRKITVSDLDKKLAAIRAKGEEIGAIFIDFIQLMSSELHSNTALNEKLADISQGVKSLGKKYGCPVVALSQLNRELEKRADKRPIMSDLRESGALEQDADIIMFVYRPAVYLEKEIKEKLKNKPNDEFLLRELALIQNNPTTPAEIILGKVRNGATGYVDATFIKKTSAFVAPADEADDPFNTSDIYD